MPGFVTTRARRRALALAAAGAAALGSGLVAAPGLSAAAPTSAPAVQSVALETSQTAVTSSTGHALRVQVTASQTQPLSPGQATSGQVSVVLSTGTSDKSEIHEWRFEDADGALNVDSTSSGRLSLPGPEIAPFGKLNLTITPVGSATTQSCEGTPRSQTQNVTVAGTFFFDTMSTGKNAWGTVGKDSKGFTFAATNTVTTTYVNVNPAACLPDFANLPCSASLFWQSAPNDDLSLSGAKAGKHGSIFASRTTDLNAPVDAKRIDEAYGTSGKLVLGTSGRAASLSVRARSNSKGSAKLSAKKHGKPFSVNCKKSGKSRVQTSTTWSNARFHNGGTPLAVKAQIFGAIKVPNNGSAEIVRTSLS